MTIKEYAKSKGISGQAVYQRVKSKGFEISSLVDPETKHLTQFGMDTLNDLYSQVKDKSESLALVSSEEKLTIERLTRELEQTNKELESMKQAADLLQIKLTAAEQRASQAETNLIDWKKQAQDLASGQQKLIEAMKPKSFGDRLMELFHRKNEKEQST